MVKHVILSEAKERRSFGIHDTPQDDKRVKNRLDEVFTALRAKKAKALIGYLAAGYPRFEEQMSVIRTMVENGVDILELGIPFSDPIADGPTIQFASQQSLANGTTLAKTLSFAARVSRDIKIPVVFMTYVNPILRFGFARFAKAARAAGVDGVIVPDMIIEESAELKTTLAAQNIHLIQLVAPTTPPARRREIARRSSGFVYAVSVTGVTGARRKLPREARSWLAALRRESPWPVCVGFGISGPDPIRFLKNSVDGFIVGSALIDIIRQNRSGQRARPMGAFLRRLAKECKRGG